MEDQLIPVEEKLAKQSETVKALIAAFRAEVNNSLTAVSGVVEENYKTGEAKAAQLNKLITDLETRAERKIEVINQQLQQITTQMTSDSKTLRDHQETQQKNKLEIDKLSAELALLTDRINGLSIPGINGKNIEQIRASLGRIEDQLNGEGGRLTFTQLVARAESAQTLSSTFWKVVGAVGFGTIVTIATVILGINKAPDNSATVAELTLKVAYQEKQWTQQQEELKYLRKQVDNLRDRDKK